MVRAIVWKEVREQGLIALTLMVLGAGVLVAAAALADPPTPGVGPTDLVRQLGAGQLAALLLAVTAGTVCGGALFAAEREAGTMGFLEALPVTRWALWRAKAAAGAVLAVTQIGFLVGVSAALGLVETPRAALAIGVDALMAFAWGLYGSTVARTTLGSVGVAVPAASLAAFAFLLPITLLFHDRRSNLPRAEGSAIFVALMLVTPLAWSVLRFTRPDRERAADDLTPARGPRPAARPGEDDGPAALAAVESEPGTRVRTRLGLDAALWLATRQLARPALIISGFALAFGFALLLPGMHAVLVWPGLALTAGVLAGVTVFADEQAHGTARFWGERRLPVGRVWAVKVAVHLAFAVGLAVLLVLPAAVRAEVAPGRYAHGDTTLSVVFRTMLFDRAQLGGQAWKYLLAPLAYGFAAGHLCGMLFRKTVVAAGVAGMTGGAAVVLWLPSLLAGGVWHWQVWLPPALALVPAGLLTRAWASDRLVARAPLGTLAAGVGAVFLVQAVGLAVRVLEVPDRPGGEDDIGYVAGLAPLDANDGGRTFRMAADRFARTAERVTSPLADPVRGPLRRTRVDEVVEGVARAGWPAPPRRDDEAVAEWLDEVYALDRPTGDPDKSWPELAADAARQPPGLYEHPMRVAASSTPIALLNARRMGAAVVAHGLRAQAEGDPAAFPADLRVALALGRTLRNGSLVSAAAHGRDVTRFALDGTGVWLRGLDGRADLLRAALAAVSEDERTVLTRVGPAGEVLPPVVLAGEPPADAFDPRPYWLAERYVTREQQKAPGHWLPGQITPIGGDKEAVAPVADAIGLAWSVPWERERTRRLLGLGFESGARPAPDPLLRGRPGAGMFTAPAPAAPDLGETERSLRVLRRAVLLELAVRLCQAGDPTGAVPPALTDLVARGYIPYVPTDPHDGRPFRYRVSAGEELWPVDGPPRMVGGPPVPTAQPGQAVLWSVGPNRTDEGGRTPPVGSGTGGRGTDLVFLVPLPPGRP